MFAAGIVSAIIAVQLGAFSVVLQTLFSGVTELPFNTFVLLMQPIHLAIGIVEGLATSAVVIFVRKARPEIIQPERASEPVAKRSLRKVEDVVHFTRPQIAWYLIRVPSLAKKTASLIKKETL